MPHYRKYGKILVTYSEEVFSESMEKGYFAKPNHKGFFALIHYTGIRKSEALRVKKPQFSMQGDYIVFDVLKRLKHGKVTLPLKIYRYLPGADEIWRCVNATQLCWRRYKKNGQWIREHDYWVWPYSNKTGYNIIARVMKYPHYERLNRITSMFRNGHSIGEVQNWTGLTLKALDYYMGIIQTDDVARKMAEKYGHKTK